MMVVAMLSLMLLVGMSMAMASSPESMKEHVKVSFLPVHPLPKHAGGKQPGDDTTWSADLVDVTVSSTFTAERSSSAGAGGGFSSYHLFPQYFAELALSGGSDGLLLPANRLNWRACGGRWQPAWGVDTSSEPCRGQTLSVCFQAPKNGSKSSRSAEEVTCPSWKRVINVLAVAFGNSFSQFHPMTCESSSSAGGLGVDGTTTATLNPVHQRHIASTSVNSATDEQEGVCRYGTSPIEPVCSETLSPLLSMMPSPIRNKDKAVPPRPDGVWASFLPRHLAVFAAGFHEVFVEFNDDVKESTSTLKVSLRLVLPLEEYVRELAQGLKEYTAVPQAASRFSSEAVVEVIGGPDITLPSSSSKIVWDLKKMSDVPHKLTRLLLALAKGRKRSLAQQQEADGDENEFRDVERLCGIATNVKVEQHGEVGGRVVAVIDASRLTTTTASSSVAVMLTLPLHVLHPLLHTLSVKWRGLESGGEGGSDQQEGSDGLKLVSVRNEVASNAVIAVVELTPPSISSSSSSRWSEAVLSFSYAAPFTKFAHYPPDANKAYWIPPLVFLYRSNSSSSSASCPCVQHPHEAALLAVAAASGFSGGGSVCVESSTQPLVLSLPIPDVSMPFNALAIACMVYAVAYGTVFSVTVRNQLTY